MRQKRQESHLAAAVAEKEAKAARKKNADEKSLERSSDDLARDDVRRFYMFYCVVNINPQPPSEF